MTLGDPNIDLLKTIPTNPNLCNRSTTSKLYPRRCGGLQWLDLWLHEQNRKPHLWNLQTCEDRQLIKILHVVFFAHQHTKPYETLKQWFYMRMPSLTSWDDSQWQCSSHWFFWGICIQLGSEDQSMTQLCNWTISTDTHHPDGQVEKTSVRTGRHVQVSLNHPNLNKGLLWRSVRWLY